MSAFLRRIHACTMSSGDLEMRRLAFAVVLTSTLTVSSAEAMLQRYCAQPTAPTTYLGKPTRPFCAAMRTCSDVEVSSYRADIARYFQRLRSYAQEAEDFYQQAGNYMECMSRLD